MDRSESGDHIHVPSNARHAWRNLSGTPTVVLIITTKKIGQFFQETGRPVTESPQPVTSEDLAVRSDQRQIWLLERLSCRERSGRDTLEFLNPALIKESEEFSINKFREWIKKDYIK